jgi:hypothetical protein
MQFPLLNAVNADSLASGPACCCFIQCAARSAVRVFCALQSQIRPQLAREQPRVCGGLPYSKSETSTGRLAAQTKMMCYLWAAHPASYRTDSKCLAWQPGACSCSSVQQHTARRPCPGCLPQSEPGQSSMKPDCAVLRRHSCLQSRCCSS